ncbi:hypothetical protein GCM10027091_03320 [Streptomyces daliensis]
MPGPTSTGRAVRRGSRLPRWYDAALRIPQKDGFLLPLSADDRRHGGAVPSFRYSSPRPGQGTGVPQGDTDAGHTGEGPGRGAVRRGQQGVRGDRGDRDQFAVTPKEFVLKSRPPDDEVIS